MNAVSTTVSTHLGWVLSRGAGTTTLLLSGASVGFGLVSERQAGEGRPPGSSHLSRGSVARRDGRDRGPRGSWVAGLVHTFTEGTGRGRLWFMALIALTTAPPLVLLAYRITAGQLRSAAKAVGR